MSETLGINLIVIMMIQSKFFSNCLWIGLAVMAAFSGLTEIWPINRWSVAYLDRRFSPQSKTSPLPALLENHFHSNIWLAEEWLEMGKIGEASTLLQPLVMEKNSFALRMYGKLLIQEGTYVNAIDAWVQGKNYISLLDLMQVSTEKGEISIAEKAYQGLIQPQLVFDDSFNRTLYLELINLGNETYNRGNGLEKSIEWFQRAIEIYPDHGDAHFFIAHTLKQEKENQEADTWYSKAIDLNPKMAWWWLAWANNARIIENYTLAEMRYQETLSRFPDWEYVYYELAWNYRLMGEKAKAQQNIEKALILTKEPNILFYLRAGGIYEWVKNDKKALEAYHSILLIESENNTALNSIKRLESKLQDE